MIRKFFNLENSVRGATGLLMVTLALSNVLGVIRDHFLAQKIPTDMLDTYYAAFRLPDLIFNLLILGAIASAFIPVFTSYLSKEKAEGAKNRESWHVVNSFLNLVLVGIILSAILLAALMPSLVHWLVPRFSPEKQILTAQLSRLFLLTPIFFGLSYIFGGVLNSFRRFTVYSLAPLVYNLSIIAGALLLTDSFGVWGVAYGVVVGSFLHLLIQLPAVFRLGYRWTPVFDWVHSGVRRIGQLMIPRTIGLGASQIVLLVYTAIASATGVGAVAIFNLANNIQTMPTVVFGNSFATALFPTLSEAASSGQHTEFLHYLSRGIRSILFLLMPATLGIILLRAQIVRLVLGSGYFSWSDTKFTAQTLGYFAVSLFAQGLIPLLARAFYAFHDTKSPMWFGIIGATVSIILGWLFAPRMGVAGLALAFSIGSVINFGLLYGFLKNKVPTLSSRDIFWDIYKIITACALMVVGIQATKYLVGNLVDMQRFWGVLVQTVLAILVGAIVYLAMAYVLKVEELVANGRATGQRKS